MSTINGIGTRLCGVRKLNEKELNKWSKHFPYIPHVKVTEYNIAAESFVIFWLPIIPLRTRIFFYTNEGAFNSQYVVVYSPKKIYWPHIKTSPVFYAGPFVVLILIVLIILS